LALRRRPGATTISSAQNAAPRATAHGPKIPSAVRLLTTTLTMGHIFEQRTQTGAGEIRQPAPSTRTRRLNADEPFAPHHRRAPGKCTGRHSRPATSFTEANDISERTPYELPTQPPSGPRLSPHPWRNSNGSNSNRTHRERPFRSTSAAGSIVWILRTEDHLARAPLPACTPNPKAEGVLPFIETSRNDSAVEQLTQCSRTQNKAEERLSLLTA